MRKLLIKNIKNIFNYLGFEISRSDKYKLHTYREYFPADLKNKPFYNIGAGSFYHPYWTNIDYVSEWYGDVQKNVVHHDLMSNDPLPITDKQAKVVYTSHTIEHVSDNAVRKLFAEVHRSLGDGGVFRITTGPDAETDYKALVNKDEDWFYWDKMYSKKGRYEALFHSPATEVPLSERWLNNVASQLAQNNVSPSDHKFSDKEIWAAINKYGFPDVLDYFAGLCEFQPERPGNHISWWTHEKIFQFLEEAGFTNIYRSGFGQSVCPILRNTSLFDNTHPQMSIYVEAIK